MPEYSNRNPGPGFDGKAEMVRWFNHWLKDDNENSDIMNEPDITLFIRTSLTTGTYRYESQWPIARQQTRRMFMSKGQKLVEQPAAASSTASEGRKNNTDVDTLEYRPWIGFEAGAWLGGLTGDQRSFDKYCLVYESDLITEAIEVVGFVKVSLQVSTTARLAHWIVRLEDVDMTLDQVWLVAVGALNGAQRQTPPAYLELNDVYTVTFQLHFTTWTFLSDHRIRVAVSNAMFYSNWPTPFPMNTSLYLNPSSTFVDLPIIPVLTSTPPPPPFTQLQVSPVDILPMPFSGGTPRTYHKHETDLATTITFEQITYELLPNGCFMSALLAWNFTCSHLDPGDVRWTTHARQVYVFGVNGYASINDVPMQDDDERVYPDVDLSIRRHFELNTELVVVLDQNYFYVNLKRELLNPNGGLSESPVMFVFN
ncbi:unnamed protein product [Didymodactylos carnosus]|uniref:Xaa-Pro dipeptidyl-peptidase C-terminal domain-containing protein n=1 Tax=Didymodactylos carnosus TaxID=1234261 RepID=A0A8S2FE49_9BILA|nr:unnamed protein product [Didymodactylos carnosus]CAF4234941.1 unnamed protein product [Didymodactylos carnosus]